MKKVILLTCSLIILSGCATSQPVKTNMDNEQKTSEQTSASSQPVNTDTSVDQKSSAQTSTTGTVVIMKTNLGDIKIELFEKESPKTVKNFLDLAKKGFYDGTKFHRVIKDFMIQGGDPNSKDDDWSNDGTGGPGYTFEDEFNSEKLVKGSLAMANAGPNTNGSQFFIVTKSETPWLDGKHTNFGKVIEGMDVVDKIEALPINQNDHPTQDATIKSIEIIK